MMSTNRATLIKKEARRPLDYAAYLIATGAGAGFAPIAPGTFGSMEGVIIYFAIIFLPAEPRLHAAVLLGVGVLLFVVGIWAANFVCRATGLKDPGEIVIDEVSGQIIGLVPLALAPSLVGALLAFLLFRLFDIFKPYPIYKLEQLPSGLGVMADDALAGVYTAALIWAAMQAGIV